MMAGTNAAEPREGTIEPLRENWIVAKPAVSSQHGVVAAQHALAAAAGAEILAAGGNAVDAAVATAFALGIVEPWMSGIGGAGYLLYGEAATGRVSAVEFGLVAPAALDPARYALVGGQSASMFGWPKVEGDRNLKGHESILVPGSVDGLGLAVERFGRKSFAEVLAPARRLLERGLPLDWHATLSIAVSARELAEFAASRELYLPDGMPPVSPPDGPTAHLPLPALAATYRRLAEAGRRDFYEGALAEAILADLGAGGSVIAAADLAGYRARIVEPTVLGYRGVRLHGGPALTGGPTWLAAMRTLEGSLRPAPNGEPDGAAYVAYAEALRAAFEERLRTMGEGAPAASNTTHLSVVDRDGNMAALTNTLLARFGSKVVLPRTGITMNNGAMWFDPAPGRANSIGPGKRPLANMCPALLTRDGRPWVALGACGGRKIIPAVTQLASFLVDFAMPLDKAFATPRLDASGAAVVADRRLPAKALAALRARLPVEIAEERVYPAPFAIPSAVMRDAESGRNVAMAHIHSPAAAAVAAGL